MTRFNVRLDFGPGAGLGPGKIDLLGRVDEHGSISAAGRSLGMSYRRAWVLIDQLNSTFDQPVIETRPGGRGGGGARVTDFGHELIAQYRLIEREAEAAVTARIEWLADRLQRAR